MCVEKESKLLKKTNTCFGVLAGGIVLSLTRMPKFGLNSLSQVVKVVAVY